MASSARVAAPSVANFTADPIASPDGPESVLILYSSAGIPGCALQAPTLRFAADHDMTEPSPEPPLRRALSAAISNFLKPRLNVFATLTVLVPYIKDSVSVMSTLRDPWSLPARLDTRLRHYYHTASIPSSCCRGSFRARFVDALHSARRGPPAFGSSPQNHMGRRGADNAWCPTLCEWGPGARRFADIFDNSNGDPDTVVPDLKGSGAAAWLAINRRRLGKNGEESSLLFDPDRGYVSAWYFAHRLSRSHHMPIPRSWRRACEPLANCCRFCPRFIARPSCGGA